MTAEPRRSSGWGEVLEAAGVNARDRVVLALPLTWAIGADVHRALMESSAETLQSDDISLQAVLEFAATVLIATPSDALRLTFEAARNHIVLTQTALRLVVLTGEPGGSFRETRRALETRWAARCLDVYALNELGVIGWSCSLRQDGIHLDDRVLQFDLCVPDTDVLAPAGDIGELLVTTPSMTHRTGDLLRLERADCPCGRGSVWAPGGVRGKSRDYLHVRGRELLPSTIEQIVRRHPAVLDFRLRVYPQGDDDEVAIDLETSDMIASESDRSRVAAEVSEDVKRSIGIRLECDVIPRGTLRTNYDDGRRARRLRRQ